VVDERSAAFVALGLARGTRTPVALLCTSGTAAANYLPAIVEARLTATPLIVITADRPSVLLGCAAPQTIDQTRLYGTHVLSSISLAASDDGAALARLRRQILATLAIAVGVEPGPVHINAHTAKPLEPVDASAPEERALVGQLDALIEATERWSRASLPVVSNAALDQLVTAIHAEPRGLITCGFDPEQPELDALALARFARAAGFPVLLDAAHLARFNAPDELREQMVAPFEPLLRVPEWHAQEPRLIIQIGRPLTSSQFERWSLGLLAQSRCRMLMLARRGWPDPSGHAQLVGQGDLSDALGRAATKLAAMPTKTSDWRQRWLKASTIAEGVIRGTFDGLAKPEATDFGELTAVATVLERLPPGSCLVIGNSLPIRELDLVATRSVTAVRGEALRGASGIDGVVSTAVGFAMSSAEATTLLVGDVSFLHDIGGLWAAQRVTSPLAIVVINNGGGRIFEQLPVASIASAPLLEYWTTPHHANLAAAAAVFGLEYERADAAVTLSDALQRAHRRPGATVIEVLVPSDSAVRQSQELTQRIQSALLRAGLVNGAIGHGG
jgi:2-succinyl-5-enolpyruvyl-6-hydroxy-3-cyclohexene-1-carboxylate synthase